MPAGAAEAYGENCVYAGSGQSVFTAKETDFYITANVKNIKDNNELGKWIVSAMTIVNTLPPDSISGPKRDLLNLFSLLTTVERSCVFQSTNIRASLQIPVLPT